MPGEKPLTKKDLASALRTALKDVPTRKEVFEMVSQASEAVLTGVERMIQKLDKKVDRGFEELRTGQRDFQRQINDLKINTPTRKEFEELKQIVHRHHPIH